MASKRSIAIASAAAASVGLSALGATAFATQDDPTVSTGGVVLQGMDLRSDPGSPAAPGADQQVAALDRIEGVLERSGDDADDFHVGAVEMEFGPDEWVRTAGPVDDYDADGTPEDLLVELEGLVGRSVTALVRLDDDGDDADVYVLNDVTYRDSAGGPAPWLQGGAASASSAAPEAVAEAAAAEIGEGARVEELDRESVGDVAWEAEVVAADGREHTVLLDAAGVVLDARMDD